jgi:uncharacterized protein YndB with AHSA1/START domain
MPENSAVKTKNVHVTRVFDAPVNLVWKAFTDPQHIMRWWGPNYFTCPSCEMDFRVGGRALVCMRSPDGQDFYNTWTFTKIMPMERLEYVQNLSDKEGNLITPESVGLPSDFPKDVQTIITFKALGGQTEMTITEFGFPDSQMYVFAEMGLNQTLDKMAATFIA